MFQIRKTERFFNVLIEKHLLRDIDILSIQQTLRANKSGGKTRIDIKVSKTYFKI